jgi:hypothetical protein
MSSTTVNFNLKTAGFADYANQTLSFRLLTAGADGSGNYVVLPGIVTATSDSSGDGSVTLFRNGVSDIESVYEVILPNREKVQFIIPSGTATVELSNLLVNSQPTGSTTQQSSVYAEATSFSIQRANHTGNLTLGGLPNGANITGELAIENGGTNASSASAARTSLDAQQHKAVLDDLGALPAPVSDGQFIVATGEGAFQYESGATARTSLDAQQQQEVLDDLGALPAPASDGQFIVATGAGVFQYEKDDVVRTSLGLGTVSTQASNSVDIDGGAIDGTVIGANSPAGATFTSLDVSEGDITNAGDINCDSISSDDASTGLDIIFDGSGSGENSIILTANLANALDIKQGALIYLKFDTNEERVEFQKDLYVSGSNLVTGTGTGTKIGTAVDQLIGFFNATPVAQQNTTGTASGFTEGTGTAVNTSTTFSGGSGAREYTVGDIVLALKNLGLLQKDN